MRVVAYFVSPHGFGHAARASAVMAELRRRHPALELHVFTTVPRWFFDDSLEGPLTYHPLRTDVGLEQDHPFVEDLAATVAALEHFWVGLPAVADEAATILERCRVELVVSDISPLGLVAAGRAGISSVLVENFTWDWIYGGYCQEEPRLEEFARRNQEVVESAKLRIQAEPVCRRASGSKTVAPIGRRARAGRAQVRRAVGLERGDARPLVLLTMGGMGWQGEMGPGRGEEVIFVTLGGRDAARRGPGWLALPDRSPIYPPDLVAAADLVVAKLGYSTVAECLGGGSRLLFLDRPRFAESAVLAEFCRRELGARRLEPTELTTGAWLGRLPEILNSPAPAGGRATGAREVARLLGVLHTERSR